MGVPDLSGLETCCKLSIAVAVITVVGTITLLVTGILGACNILAISPVGSYVMIGVSIVMFAIFTAGLVAIYKNLADCVIFNP